MSVSRRFESRFKVSFSHCFTDIGTVHRVQGLQSTLFAQPKMNIDVPASGYAFQINYYGGWGDQVFVASPYITTSPTYWDDATWGRKPYAVTWYDDDETAVLTGTSASSTGRYGTTIVKGARTVRYLMRLAFWHQVDVLNNSEHPVTVFSRSHYQHAFAADGDWGSDQMTSWTGTEIGAGNSFLVSGFRPLEIKFDADSTTRDLLGVTQQDGSRTLLLF